MKLNCSHLFTVLRDSKSGSFHLSLNCSTLLTLKIILRQQLTICVNDRFFKCLPETYFYYKGFKHQVTNKTEMYVKT